MAFFRAPARISASPAEPDIHLLGCTEGDKEFKNYKQSRLARSLTSPPAGDIFLTMFKIATVFLYASLTGFSLILGVIIGTTLKLSQKVIAAINALNEKYEDMIKSGILDPTKVVRIALQNTSSIAGL